MSERAAHSPSHEAPLTASFYLAIAIGGAVGGYLRVGLGLLPFTGSSASWPWITFGVNIAGTFVLALTVALLHARGRSTSVLRPLIGVGFCGALTTFSTLQFEVVRMLRADEWLLAGSYLSASVVAGIAAAYAGIAAARGGRPG